MSAYDYDEKDSYDYAEEEEEEDLPQIQGMDYYDPEEFLKHVSKMAPKMDLEDLKHAKYGLNALHSQAVKDGDKESTTFFYNVLEIVDGAISSHYGVSNVHDIPEEELLPEDVVHAKSRGNLDSPPQPKLLDSVDSVHDPENVMAQYVNQAKDLKRHMRRKYLLKDDDRSFVSRDFDYANTVGEHDHMVYQYIAAGFMHRMIARGYLHSGRESMDDMFWGKEEYSKDYLKNLGNGIQKSLHTQVKDWDAGIDYATLRGSLIRLEMEREDAGDVDSTRAKEFFETTSAKFKERWHSILKEHVLYEKKAIDTVLSQSNDNPKEGEDLFKSEESRKAFEEAKDALHGKVADDVVEFWGDVIHCSFGNSKKDTISEDMKTNIRDAWIQHVDATLECAKNMALFHTNISNAKKAEYRLYEDGNALGKVLNQYIYLDMGLPAQKRKIRAMHEELF